MSSDTDRQEARLDHSIDVGFPHYFGRQRAVETGRRKATSDDLTWLCAKLSSVGIGDGRLLDLEDIWCFHAGMRGEDPIKS